MGKTEKGAVWLNEKLLSAYDYWQFGETQMIAMLKISYIMFTDLSTDRINKH